MNSNELAKLIDAFERSRLVTLWGAPGVGKSHACARYANEVVARDGSPIGSSCVSSHDLQDAADPEDVLRTLTCDLPYPVKDAATALAGLEQIANHCDGLGRDLVVLDNLHAVAAGRLVDVLLAGSERASFLVSARAPLQVEHEQTIQLGPLDGEASRRLYSELSQRKDPVDSWLDLLGGVPQAIRLAALTANPSEFGRLLVRRGSADGGLRAAAEVSYGFLSKDLQNALVDCSVCVGGLPEEAIERILEVDLREFEQLVARGFVRSHSCSSGKDGRRFTVPLAVREFCSTLPARSSRRDGAEQRHAQYFLQVPGWLSERERSYEFQLEAGNVLAAVSRSQKDHGRRLFSPVLETLWGLHGWDNYGQDDDDSSDGHRARSLVSAQLELKLTDILLASAQTVQQREWAYEELTETLRRCGRHGDAEKALQQAEGLSVQVGELQDLERKADEAARKGKYAVQERHLRKRLRLLAAQGDREGATRVEQAILRNLCDQARWSDAELLIEGLVTATQGAVATQRLAIGFDAVTIYRKLRRLGDARRWADEACAVAADLPGRDQARALAHLAVVDLAQGDAKTAQKGFRAALCLTRQPDGDVVARLFPADHDTPDQALALFEELVGHASGYATQPRPGGWLAGIGNAHLPQGRFFAAEKYFAAALDIAQQSNDAEEFRDYLLVGLGAACAASDPQRARQCLENALNGAQARNDSVCGAMANWNLANLLVDAGQTRRAAELYDQAEGVLRGQYDTEQAGVLIASSLCFVALSDTAGALEALGKADKLLRRRDKPRWRGVAAVARGFTHVAAKDYSAAKRDLQKGRKLAATAGDLSSQGRADCYLGLVAALTGKITATSSFSRAEPVLREIGDLQGLEILKACRHALDQGDTESQLVEDSRCIEARLIHAWIRSAN